MSMTDLTELKLATLEAEAKREAGLYRIAWIVTAGAIALALSLGLGLPARAEAKPALNGDLVQLIDHRGDRNGRWEEPRGHKKGHRATIPAACAMEIGKGRNAAVVYPERCLRRHGVDVRLPNACADVRKVRGERLRVYYERCLREAGFRTGRDHRPRDWRGDHWGR